MPDDLYEQDVLIWSEQQAELLRRLSRGERVNDQVDWPNVIEEVHDVGLSHLNAVRSLLRQAIVHVLKQYAWPDGPVPHWRSETRGFLADAQQRFSPSMRQRIDMDHLYRQAVAQILDDVIDGKAPRTPPPRCPFSIEQLLADEVDIAALVTWVDGRTA
jgi:hypothetical protein